MATIIISDQVQQPWGEWLTKALMDMGGRNISAIALVAKDAKTEDVFTGYWHCGAHVKMTMAGILQTDATLDCVKANIGSILEAADDEDSGSG